MTRFYAYPYNANNIRFIKTLLISFILILCAYIDAQAQTPAITLFAPSSGPVGTEITITGSGFMEAHTVTIGAGSTYDFTIVSDSEIKVKVSALASNGIIRVISNQGSGTGSGSYTIVNAPVISSITPSSGPVGTEVTISGSNFSTATSISIGSGSTTNFTIGNGGTEIKFKVPASASSGSIRLNSSQGSSNNSSSYTLTNAPVISNFTPSSGPVGTEVTITGSNLTTVTAISIGSGSVTNFTKVSDTELKATVPSSASTGSIRVSSNQGSGSSSGSYTVVNAPVISSFRPSSGPVGTEVTITGSDFLTTTGVSIGSGTATSFTVVSNTEIKVTVPTLASNGSIRVLTNNGQTTSFGRYVLLGSPVITSFTPMSGPAGSEVILTGSNFTGTSLIYLGGYGKVTNYTVVNDTQIKLTVPSTATSGLFYVRTSKGQVNSKDQFTVTGSPSIISFSPVSAAVGEVITITGSNFSGTKTIYFGNGSTTNFTIINDTEIQVAVPSLAATGKIQVMNNNGNSISPETFTLIGSPVITSFTPMSGPAGSEVILTGSNFTGTSLIYLGGYGKVTNYTVVNDTQIKLTVPSTATSGLFYVRTSKGQVNSKDQFTKTNPFISTTSTEVNFADVPVGSNQVKEYQVSGLGLKNGEAVTINLGATSPYTISINAGSGFGKSVTLNTVSNNKLNATSIFVKYEATVAGEKTDVILHQQGTTASKSLNIRGNGISPLPVELIAFNAVLKNGQVNLSWSTASEKDNSHFEIEKASGSLSNFRKIDAVKSKVGTSATTTNYSFSTYYNSNGATEYYRLKQVDLDGTPKYSKVVSVKPSSISKQMEVAPNPISEDSKIYFTADADGKAIIKVTSVTGKQIYFEQIDVHGGENAVQLSKYSKLMPSVYIVTVEHDGKRESVRIEKK